MEERLIIHAGAGLIAAAGLAAFVALFFVTAPYGRHARRGWGPTLPARLAWLLIELPASAGFFAVYAFGAHRAAVVPLCLLGLWQLHYLHRTLIYPLRLGSARPVPLGVVVMSVLFYAVNASLNARWISNFAVYDITWLHDPRFVGGAVLMLLGFAINVRSDSTLVALRRAANGAYGIPRGGLFRWVSCPNYLGECVEWIGWALATGSTPGAAFALFTLGNLVPRALAHHRWYRERFADYPTDRRALIPFLL